MLVTAAVAAAVVLTATAVLAGTTTPAPAPPTQHTRVDGSVLDREGTAVAGATVMVRPAGAGAAPSTFELVTDAHGHFHLDGLAAGTYWFIAFGAGLSAGATPAVPVFEHLEVEIRLEEQATRA
jgi:hypothetical protein